MMKQRFRAWTIPLALLALCLVSYGLWIPKLGFYFDDWPVLLVSRLPQVSDFWKFYQFDRPFSAWTFALTAPILGTRPLVWHVFTLFLRWLTVLGMWWSLKGLWPRHARQVAWMAFLFAIYPVFDQQTIAVAYSQHWITYGLFFLSLGAMIQSVRVRRWFWPYTILALGAAAFHLLTMEYFVGLELLRPVVLWILEEEKEFRQRIRVVLRTWIPYALLLVLYVIWRLFFLKLPGEDPNNPALIYNLASQPLGVIVRVAQLGIQDTVNLLVSAWYRTLDPTKIIITDRSILFSWFMALLSAAGLAVYLMRMRSEEETPSQAAPQRSWITQAMLLGGLAILLGPLPVWLTDRQAITSLYGGRFALASMFGASIFMVGILEIITPLRLPKIILVSSLVGLAVGFHLRTAHDFTWYWNKQYQFYWQLYWRAPYIKPDTAIYSDGEIFSYMGKISTATAINLLYPFPPEQSNVSYWFYELYPGLVRHLDQAVKGLELRTDFRTFHFSGSTQNSILINYEPEAGRCLWVLGPLDEDNSDLPKITYEALPLSNLNRIEPVSPASGYPPQTIFGPEPEHTWCYFFQKADLARQMGDWKQVAQLGDQAQKEGNSPNDPQEWLPFIEGYAHVGNWEAARTWSLHVFKVNQLLSPRLCNLWDRIEADVTPPANIEGDIAQMRARFSCEPAN